MKTWKEIGDTFDMKLKQSIPDLMLTIQAKMEYFAAAQAYLQTETQRIRRKEVVVIAAGTPVQQGTDMSFRIDHALSVWDTAHNIQYGIRDWDQYQDLYANIYSPPDQPNIIPPVVPLSTTDFNGYIVGFDDRQIFVFPSPTVDIALTVAYHPVLPELSASDPYWTAWYASSAAFKTNYASATPEREFYPYTDAIVDYAIIQHCEGFDSKWADKMVARSEVRLAKAIDSIKRHRPQYHRFSQAKAYGDGLDYFDPNGQYGNEVYGRIL